MKKQTIHNNKKPIISAQAPAAWLGTCLLSLGLAWAPPTLAAEVTCTAGVTSEFTTAGMNCFNPNTAAKSGQVNANFKVLLERIAALEAKLAAVSDSSTADYLLIEGANVQITNGAGTTDTVNGKGNLIIGYNAAATRNVCSNGSGNNQTDCENNGGTWGTNQRQGSHNVVIGDQHQYSQYGGFVTGLNNVINGEWASVSGGRLNTASGKNASVSGGGGNTASEFQASVSGGAGNTASSLSASVSGGWLNTATALAASVSGGFQNNASGASASVSGGLQNNASGQGASVIGGQNNTAGNTASTVVGSQNLTTSADYETIP